MQPKTIPFGQEPAKPKVIPFGSAPAPVAPKTSPMQQVTNFGIGLGSAIGKTVAGAPEAVSRIMGAGINAFGENKLGNAFINNANKIKGFSEQIYQKPFEKQLDTVGGQVGNVTGNVLPFFLTGGASAGAKGTNLVSRLIQRAPGVLADTAITAAQTGGDLKASGATGLTSAVANTLLPGSGGFVSRTLKGAVPGYVGDVSMGLAGQRGEDRTGAQALIPGLGTALGTAFSGVSTLKSPAYKQYKAEATIKGREKILQKLEDNYQSVKKVTANAKGKGIDVKKMLAGGDLLVGSVDNTGTIRTTGEGGAIQQLNDFIKPQEGIISQRLEQEGASISLTAVQKKLRDAVMNSGLQGGALTRALKNVEDDVAGYALRLDKNGNIPLATVHSAKVDKYANINYLNPESKRADKVIAKTLKQIVEDNSSVEVKKLNQELSNHYSTLNLLEKLDGKKVEGGRLGKLFAQTIGGMVGSHFGPLGTIAGAEIGGLAKGAAMARTFGKKTGSNLSQSELMKQNIAQSKSKNLGSRNTSQSTTITPEMTKDIKPIILPPTPKTQPKKPLLALPAPKPPAITMGGLDAQGRKIDAQGNLIVPPQPKNAGRLVEAKKFSYQDKKTGRFARGYQSGKINPSVLAGLGIGSLAGVEKDSEGKLRYDIKKGLGGALAGGAIGLGAGKAGLALDDVAKNIHPEDKAVMTRFIDSARIGSKLSDNDYSMATKLMEKFGISQDKSLGQIADQFDKILSGQKKVVGTAVPGSIKKKLGDTTVSKDMQADTSAPFEGEYLYHGTSKTAFENIMKEGIKPQRRGVTSLSKSEDYSKNWAFPEATKTQGVMLRVKANAVKTTPSTSGVPSDTLNELLTKEIISPKDIEVFKDGKWQPLIDASPLLQEARKYKSAEEFVKAQGTPNLYNVGDSFELGKIIENPFKEGVPSAEKAQEINKYLQANKDKYNPKYVKFYHGTAKGLPIEDKGLLPTSATRRKSYQSESGYVYLANTPERAKTFGDLGNMSKSDVYEVVVPVNKLMADLDQLNNIRSTGEKVGNTVGESIVYGGGVRIKGKIEPYAIRKLPDDFKTKSQLTDIWKKANNK